MPAPLNLDQLLETLGHHTHVSLCHQQPGQPFRTMVVAADQAQPMLAQLDGADVWFGVNPVAGPPRQNAGRGTADQVEHLAALYADLDVKPGGLANFDVARTVVDGLAEALEVRPSAITLSGHGLQPYWPIEDPPTGADARAMLRRFGRLVAAIAERHGGHVDSVYDLARVLRVPGTQNLKDPANPAAVLTLTDDGHPIGCTEVYEALDRYAIGEQPEDREALTAVLAPSGDWTHAEHTCVYVRHMVDAWKNDTPDARHPWLLSQTTRLAAAHRSGCISADDHAQALTSLVARFRALLATGSPRSENPGEIADAIGWGRARIAVKDDAGALAELGAHTHDDAVLQLVGNQHTPEQPPLAPPWRPRLVDGGQSPGAGPSGPQTPTDGATALQPRPSAGTLDRSEDGHAQHLIAAYGDLIRYCPQRSAWLAWDGTVWQWQPKGGGVVREYSKNVARDFPQTDQAAIAHKRRCLSSAGTTGCLAQAATDGRVVVDLPDLDARPWILNTPAGIVDLRTGEFSPPDPAALCTKTTTAAPDFTTDDHAWTSFLAQTFGADTDLAGYIQRLFGVTLIGQVREQVLPFAHGPGANGKSTLLEAVMHALGVGPSGYAIAAPAEMLMIRKHSEHPAELAQLAGARLVVCSELDDGQKFAEAKIKQLTGRDSINARFLYGQPFTFSPSHTIWLLGNHRPQARTGGMAFWRRVKLLEFSRIVPADRRDPALGDKLAAAAGTILAWAIRGAVDYHQHGMGEPDGVAAATEAYAADQDTVGRFVEDQVHLSPGVDAARVPVAELRTAYERWCSDTGETPVLAKRLSQELRDRFGVSDAKSGSRRFYTGLTLYADETEPDDEREDPWAR